MWDKERYLEAKTKYQSDIDNKIKKPYDLMLQYKRMIKIENYEAAKAITEVLKPLNYDTADTHIHIPELQLKTPIKL